MSNFYMIVFASSYDYFMFDCDLLEACSFLMTYRKGMDQDGKGDGEELGSLEGGETVIII